MTNCLLIDIFSLELHQLRIAEKIARPNGRAIFLLVPHGAEPTSRSANGQLTHKDV